MDVSAAHRNNDPAYRRLHRAFFAACIVLAPLALSLWFTLCPQYGNPACPDSGNDLPGVLVAFRTANPLLMQMLLFLTLLVPYLYPLSYIGLGLLAMKRAPWLATIGIACGFIGSIPWGLVADQTFLLNSMAQLGSHPLFIMLEKRHDSSWQILIVFIAWIIGHLLGYVFLGIALARARAVPVWAASLIIVSAIVMGPLAYTTGIGLFQVLGYALVLVGSIPAAFAILRAGEK